jgi:phage terminase large subunit
MEQSSVAIKHWREDPTRFVRDNFGVEPDPWQDEILQAFPKHQRIAMKACKGPGKTCLIAWLCWNFLATRPHAKLAATSITADNLRDGLWAEMAKWQGKSEFLKNNFQWTKTNIFCKESPADWFMSARAWPKGGSSQQQADTLAGLHADYIMFVLDESGGIPQSVMAAAEAALSTGKEMKIVQAGNPTHTEGPLYRASTVDRHLWYVVNITGDPDNPKRSPRIDVNWARDQIASYGADNPYVLVNVFGEFPPSSLNALLGIGDIEESMSRRCKEEDYKYSQKRLGVDVARFGDDRTIIFPRQGLMSFKPVEMRNSSSIDVAMRVLSAKHKWRSELELVDGTGGYGAGVIDYMRKTGGAPMEIHFNGKAMDAKYYNKRSEMWFEMAEWVKKGGCLPKDVEGLSRELAAPTYCFKGDKLFLEPKDQIKSRLGYSPDIADALALTFAIPDMRNHYRILNDVMDVVKIETEWEPLDESIRSNDW